jgi:dGTP triphosphohydrolase
MEWKTLLYARRKEPLDIPDDLSKYPMNDFELDYWRIVNSAPFRRLQDKTTTTGRPCAPWASPSPTTPPRPT